MKKILIITLFVMIFLSANGFAYTYSNGALYCTTCADCKDAISNVTFNTTYLNISLSGTKSCISNPADFNNVIFDCQGYTIDGDDDVNDYAITTAGKYNNTIRNCIITDFGVGIKLSTSTNHTLINNTLNSNSAGIGFTASSNNNTIVNNTLISNTYGIQYYSSPNNTISNNTMNSNTYAIWLQDSSNNTINNNIGSSNSYGIYRYVDSRYNTFQGNMIKNTYDEEFALFFNNESVTIEINQTGEKIGYELLWFKDVTGSSDEYSGPTIINGIVYVTGKTYGMTFALNETTGEEIWNYTTGAIDDGSTYVDGVLYVPSFDYDHRKVYALNATNGNLIWNYTQQNRSTGTPAYWNGTIYTTDRNTNILYALNASNEVMSDSQRSLWNYSGDNCSYYESSATVIDGILYAGCVGTGSEPGLVFALNATNGSSIWNFSDSIQRVWDSSPMIYGDKMYIGTYTPTKVYSLNKTNGSVIWSYSAGGIDIATVPTLHNGVVFAGGHGNILYAIDDSNGNLIWSYNTGNAIYSTPVIPENGIVYTGSNSGKFYGLNETTGYALWTYTVSLSRQIFSQQAVANGKLFGGADDWKFRVFNLGEGSGNWTTLGYNQSRNAVTPDGLTTHRYVTSICSASDTIVTCNITNNYNEAKSAMLINTNNFNYVKYGDIYQIYVEDDKVFLPKIRAGQTIEIELVNGTYNSSIPRLIDTKDTYSINNRTGEYSPNYIEIINATYNPSLNETTIRINGTGTNKNISLNYSLISNTNIFDDQYSDTVPVIEIRNNIITTTIGNYLADYNSTNKTLKITIPTMSEHIITITEDNTPPVRSGGSPTGTVTTSSTTLYLETNENATCRYSYTTSGIPYTAMTSTNTDWGTTHSWSLTSLNNGLHNYYIRCIDTVGNYNEDDYPINFTVSIFQIIVGGQIDDIEDREEIPIDEIEIGQQYNIPDGGLKIWLDWGMILNTLGDNVTVHNFTEIDPNDYRVLLCNQTMIYAYEINITADEAYLCFDKNETDLKAVSIYTIINGDWTELTEIIEKDNQICGKITSSPYMIAGFDIPATADLALEKIIQAQERIDSYGGNTTLAEQLLLEARDAYYNCKYDEAYDLAQEAIWTMPFIIESIDLPIFLQFGVPLTLTQMELILMFSELYGYEITYIDLLPLFDIIGEAQGEFYISPIMRISPIEGGSIFDPIIDEILAGGGSFGLYAGGGSYGLFVIPNYIIINSVIEILSPGRLWTGSIS